MGVVNVTPDSFSDGGLHLDRDDAVAQAHRLVEDGADLVDIGGESTRPGAEPVELEVELGRVMPVIESLVPFPVPISIDTSKLEVAVAALDAGAAIVNDVTALRGSPGIAELCAEREAGLILTHMLGKPRTMQDDPRYEDVVGEVGSFLSERAATAVAAGVDRSRIAVDPGIGFGKTREHNLELLARLDELVELGYEVAIGTSRKRFIAGSGGGSADERLGGTLASGLEAWSRGVGILRVHDVGPMRQALETAAAIRAAG